MLLFFRAPREVPLLEKVIQRNILTFLREIGIFAWQNKSIGVFDRKRNQFLMPKTTFAIRGTSDILGILPDGRFLAIEVKNKQGKLSQAQLEFIRVIQANHGVAFVSRSVTQTFEQLKPFLTDAQKYEAVIGSWMRMEAKLDKLQ